MRSVGRSHGIDGDYLGRDVFQDLNKYFMKAFAEVRDKVLVAIKHEKAAFERKVEQLARNRKRYRAKHPKRYRGRKRGCKPKWRKKDFKPSTMKGYG